jgi:hypothetical protein
LHVPNAGYQWDFGDNSTATGPSVVHSYATAGTYNVRLTVTDRGANTRTLVQTVQVLDQNGQVVTKTGPGQPTTPVFHAGMQLLPQGLRALLKKGISVRVLSNESADGLARVTISRALAKRAGIKVGRGSYVVIGQGTLSGQIRTGVVQLRIHLPRSVTAKLAKLRHATLTVHLNLVGTGGVHQALVAAGRY